MSCVYDLQNYHQYKINYPLDDDILSNIKMVMSKLEVPNTFTSSPSKLKFDDKKDKMLKPKSKGNKFLVGTSELKTESKSLIGNETIVDRIRSNLNKLTPKNYNEMKSGIVDEIKEAIKDDQFENEVYNVILSVLTTNDFYTDIYVNIYVLIEKECDKLHSKFIEYFDKYVESFNDINQINSTEDYGEFCKQKKKNHKRICFTKFIIKLIDSHKYSLNYEHLMYIMSEVFFNKIENNKLDDLDELMLNVVLLYSSKQCKEIFLNKKLCNNLSLMDILHKITNNEYKNIHQKTIFRVMDLLEI